MIKRLIIALALGTGILFTANTQNSAVKDSLLRIYVTARPSFFCVPFVWRMGCVNKKREPSS